MVSGQTAGLSERKRESAVKGYMSSDVSEEIRKKYGIVDEKEVYGGCMVNWVNNIKGMPEDDDTNYTILALKLMEQKGFDFTPDDVGECWLNCLPILHVCTAERVAYINMVNNLSPPASAGYRNAYREYIGAQIRGDFYGYVCPGDAPKAARAGMEGCLYQPYKERNLWRNVRGGYVGRSGKRNRFV